MATRASSSRPSEPLLVLLRDRIREKGLTTSELALRCGLDRASLKRELAGTEALTVDNFIVLAQALDLDPAGLAQADSAAAVTPAPEEPPSAEPPPPASRFAVLPDPAPAAPDDESWEPDPSGNVALQALRVGFALAVDIFVHLDVRHLRESGIPAEVLARYPELLPLRFPVKFHRHHKPRFEKDYFGCVLSFDRLYPCELPWTAFRQVELTLPAASASPPANPAPEPPGRPVLRVVK